VPPDNPDDRIVSAFYLSNLRERWGREAQCVVFTNGVFDVLHRGHIDLLTEARAAGDILVVGLNSDRSVRRLKGPGRPINSQRDRALMLACLRPVDYVCIFGAETPLRLIKTLQPDILVKGAEYAAESIVGADVVNSRGGLVLRVRMRPNRSSSAIIRRGRPADGDAESA
jgi:D-beta-D-heptose 7-phosphate kinase/D-beta-D-heptose 1-phosphate adenosyltransferase